MKVRYKLAKDAVVTKMTGEKYYIDKSDTCFVDILSPMITEGICESIHIKVFEPDGNIIEGFTVGFNIKLANKDLLFDGRFNSTQV